MNIVCYCGRDKSFFYFQHDWSTTIKSLKQTIERLQLESRQLEGLRGEPNQSENKWRKIDDSPIRVSLVEDFHQRLLTDKFSICLLHSLILLADFLAHQ